MKEVIILAFVAAQFADYIPEIKPDFRPPGTIEIVDNFFFDETEVTNISWREYLADIKIKKGVNSKEYLKSILDTSVWNRAGYDLNPYKNNYFHHPAYEEYPVVGVSHQQATDYCKWRTKAVMKMLNRQGKTVSEKFVYRLPTKTEWEFVASIGFAKKQRELINRIQVESYNRAKIYNMLFDDRNSEFDVEIAVAAPARTYHPNKFGIYNIYGNVAEMVSEEGLSMGGSFRHAYKDVVPTNKPIEYEQPEIWLGFRCVCELLD